MPKIQAPSIGTIGAGNVVVRPFTVSIPDSEIDDLKQRLARTRWPDPETVGDWSQGVRVENARALVDYWARGYDSRRVEAELHCFPQFLTEIDGPGGPRISRPYSAAVPFRG
jgi:hypothetical protein